MIQITILTNVTIYIRQLALSPIVFRVARFQATQAMDNTSLLELSKEIDQNELFPLVKTYFHLLSFYLNILG